MKANNIQYSYNADIGIELILCEGSTISYLLHNHVSVFTVGIVLEGSIKLTTNQGAEVLGENSTFLIPPYVPHSISADKSYTLLTLCLDKNLIDNSIPCVLCENVISLLSVSNFTRRLNAYQLQHLLKRLNSLENYRAVNCQSDNYFIENVKEEMELYPERKLSVEEMAQNAFISKYHFIRNFKAEVGLTPHQFQIQNRIRKAQRLICEAKTITEVALTTGFCDQSHFTRQFERYLGITPLEYKHSSDIIKSD